MFLENVVFDAVDPQRAGRFWQGALGASPLLDEPDGFETRLGLAGGAYLDLCFQPVPELPAGPLRLHLDLSAGEDQQATAARLRDLGAVPLDIGQGDVPWIVLADPEGAALCVLEPRDALTGTGPLASLPLHSADPARDESFWSWLTGWTAAPGVVPHTLRHPSRTGPLLELVPEAAPKTPAKNRIHLDVRRETGDDGAAIARGILGRGGTELEPARDDLPWRIFADPSGNEFCVLPPPSR